MESISDGEAQGTGSSNRDSKRIDQIDGLGHELWTSSTTLQFSSDRLLCRSWMMSITSHGGAKLGLSKEGYGTFSEPHPSNSAKSLQYIPLTLTIRKYRPWLVSPPRGAGSSPPFWHGGFPSLAARRLLWTGFLQFDPHHQGSGPEARGTGLIALNVIHSCVEDSAGTHTLWPARAR